MGDTLAVLAGNGVRWSSPAGAQKPSSTYVPGADRAMAFAASPAGLAVVATVSSADDAGKTAPNLFLLKRGEPRPICSIAPVTAVDTPPKMERGEYGPPRRRTRTCRSTRRCRWRSIPRASVSRRRATRAGSAPSNRAGTSACASCPHGPRSVSMTRRARNSGGSHRRRSTARSGATWHFRRTAATAAVARCSPGRTTGQPAAWPARRSSPPTTARTGCSCSASTPAACRQSISRMRSPICPFDRTAAPP